jgi:hypothetical protein
VVSDSVPPIPPKRAFAIYGDAAPFVQGATRPHTNRRPRSALAPAVAAHSRPARRPHSALQSERHHERGRSLLRSARAAPPTREARMAKPVSRDPVRLFARYSEIWATQPGRRK